MLRRQGFDCVVAGDDAELELVGPPLAGLEHQRPALLEQLVGGAERRVARLEAVGVQALAHHPPQHVAGQLRSPRPQEHRHAIGAGAGGHGHGDHLVAVAVERQREPFVGEVRLRLGDVLPPVRRADGARFGGEREIADRPVRAGDDLAGPAQEREAEIEVVEDLVGGREEAFVADLVADRHRRRARFDLVACATTSGSRHRRCPVGRCPPPTG